MGSDAAQVMSVHDELVADTQTLASELMALIEDASEDSLSPLRTALDRMCSRQYVIAVVGRQKSGKSTLLNALVGDGEVVSPVNALVWTSALSIVRYGERSLARIYLDPKLVGEPSAPDDGTRSQTLLGRVRRTVGQLLATPRSPRSVSAMHDLDIREIDRGELEQWVTHKFNPGNHKGVVLAEIYSPASLLRGGLVLIDSPGIGALDPTDLELAGLVADEVDATLMIYTKEANLGAEEMTFLVQRLALRKQRESARRPTRRPVFVVQNDRGANSDVDLDEHEAECQQVATEMRRQIQREWNRRQKLDPKFPRGPAPGEQIHRVNARRAWNAAHRRNAVLRHESKIDDLRHHLTDFYVHGRGRELVMDATTELAQAIQREEATLRSQSASYGRETDLMTARIAGLETLRTRIDRLDGPLSDDQFSTELSASCEQEAARVSQSVRAVLSRAEAEISDLADEDLDRACEEADRRLRDALAEAVLGLDSELGHLDRACIDIGARLDKFEAERVAIASSGTSANADGLANSRIKYDKQVESDTSIEGSIGRWFYSKLAIAWFKDAFDDARRRSLLEGVAKANRQIVASVQDQTRQVNEKVAAERLGTLSAARRAIRSGLERSIAHCHEALTGTLTERSERRDKVDASIAKMVELRSRVDEHLRRLTS